MPLIKKLLILLAPFIVVVAFFEYRLYHMPNDYALKKNILDNNLDTSTLIFGTSHAMTGINPIFLDEKAINLAYSNQPLYDNYKILDQNRSRLPNLKRVIIGVSYFSLEFTAAKTPEYWREFLYERYWNISPETSLHLFDLKRFSLLLLYGQRESLIFASKFFNRNEAIEGILGKIEATGYQASDAHRQIVNEADHTKLLTSHQTQMNPDNIKNNASYVVSMVNATRDSGAKPILISMPLFGQAPSETYALMQKTLHGISAAQHVPYLNYTRDPRFAASDFSDAEHLNPSGAEKFTKILNADLKAIK